MDNLVVLEAARACTRAGLASLRFNFRGVGESAGTHDSGAGEVDDLTAAVDVALSEAGLEADSKRPLVLIGYSFGAAMTLRALARRSRALRASRALLLAPPVTHYDFREVAGAGVPLALVCGREDSLTPADAIAQCYEEWLGGETIPSLAEPAKSGVVWLEGAGHDLGATGGGASPLSEALDLLLAGLLSSQP
jgi:alpha/beta superfamily hydrolase